ncbi:hypothetical protein M409DRAFT_19511 [Zasmidium cellare ATCC 36951]|uniref:Ribosome assembly protein 3 n=1 Tax=Zasmidium cellare ATCC 36951 TaxID=1080233 RepID=A0A6A6CZA2_ZASCE|nr:uncharacterized protein M409DRAFT_19511 [Zasmidium cellare ATCC 36951]KAF2170696.1 hypothetical protein M409DRAFT_19511 [Zasmidium cellare ATCC 36951]
MPPNNQKVEKKARRNKRKARTEVESSSSSSSASDNENDNETKILNDHVADSPRISPKPSNNPSSAPSTTPTPPSTTTTKPNNAKVDNLFQTFYLHRTTQEFANDLDKLRSASDFHGERSVQMLVRALGNGVVCFGEGERGRVVAGWGGVER